MLIDFGPLAPLCENMTSKPGSTKHIATPSEENQALATGNMYRNLNLLFLRYVSGHMSDRQTVWLTEMLIAILRHLLGVGEVTATHSFNSHLSRMTQLSKYQKWHSFTHFLSFWVLFNSICVIYFFPFTTIIESSSHSCRIWQFFSTTSCQVFFGRPAGIGLTPSNS